MSTLREILQDKLINGFIVALVFGLGTINFISNVGGMIIDRIFQLGDTAWNWKIFYARLSMYALTVIVAILIRKRVRK